MITKDLRRLLTKLNDPTTRALEAAAGFCISRAHYEVTIEHLLLKLIEQGSGDLPLILRRFDADPGRIADVLLVQIEGHRSGNTGRPTFSPHLLQLVEAAWLSASIHHDLPEVRSGNLVEALLESSALANQEYMEALSVVKQEELREHFFDIVSGSAEDRAVRSARPSADGRAARGGAALEQFTLGVTERARAGEMDPVLGRDKEIRQIIDILSRRRKNNPILVGEAGVGKSAVVEGLAQRIVAGDVPDSLRDVEIRTLDLGLLQAGAGMKGEFENRLKSVIQEVREAAKPTILFIDEAHTLIGAGGAAGTGDAANLLKPALARGELRTIAATTWSEYKKYVEKDPALERRFQMVKIDEPSVEMATIMLRGIRERYESHHGIQITDAAIGAAAQLSDRFISGRQLPDKAVDLLDTASARVRMSQTTRPPQLDDLDRRIQYLAAELSSTERDIDAGLRLQDTTLEEKHAELERLDAERTGLEARWEREKDLVRRLNDARARLVSAMAAPSSGDGSAPKPAANAPAGEVPGMLDPSEEPPEMLVAEADPNKEIPEVLVAEADPNEEIPEMLVAEADPNEEIPEMLGSEADPREELSALMREMEEVQGESPMVHAEVNPRVAAQVVADWTGIPAGNMMRDQAQILLEMEDRLGERILGQDEAIGEMAETLRTAKAGLGNPEAPLAVFLFVGPSGVGKTESALALADMLFGGDRFLTTINMSEYQEAHTVSQLKGSPPGYVGYGEGGVLTEAVRQRPYSVVLLDEVEKAHRDVLNLFYQVFDKGFMRDGEGRDINFRNTVIIMTSNLASDIITYVSPEDERPTPDQLREAIHSRLVEHFQPALLGRMKVVPFYPLHRETMKGIVRLKLGRVGKRLRAAHGMTFGFGADVVERIAERCTEIDAGARNADFIIDRAVLPQASRSLIGRMVADETAETLTLGLNEDGDFTYVFA